MSAVIGIGFGYATYGLLSLFKLGLGFLFWWLEPVVAISVGVFCFGLCEKIATRSQAPLLERGERAIWRLAYRRGWELSLGQIVAETLLEESAALRALGALEQKGQAIQIAPDRWRLVQ
ncbi:MAG: hypothetical protein ACK41E_02280 [Deinococcales bacterium]